MARCEERSINLLILLLTSLFAIARDLAYLPRGIDGPTKGCRDPPGAGICWRWVCGTHFSRLVYLVLAHGLHALMALRLLVHIRSAYRGSGDVSFVLGVWPRVVYFMPRVSGFWFSV
jgi:hypothetical protein